MVRSSAATPSGAPRPLRAPTAGAGDDIFYGTVGANGSVGMTKGDSFVARSGSIADGSWHQVAVTRDNASGTVNVYVDGRLRSTGVSATGTVGAFFNTIGALVDVAGNLNDVQGYNYMNNTDLDDVRIYNSVVTPAEINALLPGGAIPAAPTAGTTAVDPANGSRITLTFTDNASNEAGFILERSLNGGNFVEVGSPGSSAATGGVVTFTDTAPAFNQTLVYRVRPSTPPASPPTPSSPPSPAAPRHPTRSAPVT